MTDVFISYKREDRKDAFTIAGALTQLGLDVWFDRRLPVGETFEQEILGAAREAKAIVVCWSPLSVASEWVLKEARIGLSLDKLAPVQLRQCTPPEPFNALSFADLSRWRKLFDDDNWMQLVERLAHLLQMPELIERSKMKGEGQREELIERARAMLIHRVKNLQGATITYEDAAKALQVRSDNLTTLFSALDETAAQNRASREPLLCALVVNSETHIPGRGYFQKQAFLEDEKSPLARMVWEEHIRRVREYDWPED